MKALYSRTVCRESHLALFSLLGEEKADPDKAQALLDRAQKRLENADYSGVQTPYGYFLDLTIKAPGHPLARVYKEF